MKMKIQFNMMGIYSILLLFTVFASCDKNEQSTDINRSYIDAVEVISPEVVQVEVDNFARYISLQFVKGTDITAVKLQLKLAEGVSLPDTQDEIMVLDLSASPILKVQHNGAVISFKFNISFSNPVFDPSSAGWIGTDNFGNVPEYLSVYENMGTVDGKKIKAYIAVADMNNPKAQFGVLGEKSGYQTPSEFYEANNQPVVILNAGYFYSGNALGLIIRDGQLVREGTPMVYRTVNDVKKVYYPTQAAFGFFGEQSFAADWVYTSQGVTYAYPSPAANKTGNEPLPIPNKAFPEGAQEWAPETAIGAGPMLIKNGEVKVTWESEMFDNASGIQASYNHPRSAIGITSHGYLVFFACEGRNKTPDTPGLSLFDVANFLHELGCVAAINLDGGGSSCLLVNGRETIIPSDGEQRTIVTAVAVY
ncbi:phosphodiester glycosidase family protein [Carboxylicivirga taeanensis]|uniref:phosphodiester glycosidase family protein n=1 Tax=Carboxylicivirga taeanensis TaxID=1416875 RepID=UPI003F6DA802